MWERYKILRKNQEDNFNVSIIYPICIKLICKLGVTETGATTTKRTICIPTVYKLKGIYDLGEFEGLLHDMVIH